MNVLLVSVTDHLIINLLNLFSKVDKKHDSIAVIKFICFVVLRTS